MGGIMGKEILTLENKDVKWMKPCYSAVSYPSKKETWFEESLNKPVFKLQCYK